MGSGCSLCSPEVSTMIVAYPFFSLAVGGEDGVSNYGEEEEAALASWALELSKSRDSIQSLYQSAGELQVHITLWALAGAALTCQWDQRAQCTCITQLQGLWLHPSVSLILDRPIKHACVKKRNTFSPMLICAFSQIMPSSCLHYCLHIHAYYFRNRAYFWLLKRTQHADFFCVCTINVQNSALPCFCK